VEKVIMPNVVHDAWIKLDWRDAAEGMAQVRVAD
jgi:hypothetical protein